MAQFNFIPEHYAPEFVLEALFRSVSHMITNNKFEALLAKSGDKVKFSMPNEIDVYDDWMKGDTIVSQELTDDQYELVVDRGKYFSFRTHEIDDIQVNIKNYAAVYKERGGKAMARKLDMDVFAEMVNAAHIAGTYGTGYPFGTSAAPLAISTNNAPRLFVNMASAVEETPWDDSSPRFCVAPPWLFGGLAQSELRQMNVIGGGGISPLKEGIHKLFDMPLQKFTVIPSNLLPTAGTGVNTAWPVIFGTKRAFSLVFQLRRMEVKDGMPTETPCKYHRCFWAFGMGVIYPKELGVAWVKPDASLMTMAA